MSSAQLSTTAHNFIGDTWNSGASNQACGPCHTPHNALTSADAVQAPLWSHTETTQSFTLYTGTDMDASDQGQPGGVSKLCLSCHDGSLALSDHVNGTADATLIGAVNANANLGTSLVNDHPISFTYDATLVSADGQLHPITTAALGGTIASEMLFGASKMECASCHDPHGVSGVASLLRMDNSQSQLCLTCHAK